MGAFWCHPEEGRSPDVRIYNSRKLHTTPLVHNGGGVGEVCHFSVQRTDIRRVHALEEREDFVTDAVASILHGRVGAVFAVWDFPGEDVAFDLLAGEGQEGAQDCHVATLLAMTCGVLLAMT